MSDMLRIMRINKAYLGLLAFCLFELSYGDSSSLLSFGTVNVTVGQDAPAAPADPKPAGLNGVASRVPMRSLKLAEGMNGPGNRSMSEENRKVAVFALAL